MQKEFDLTDRVAVVVGAAQGLGATVARGFARYGAHVACVDLNRAGVESVAAEIGRAGRMAIAIPCDITDESQIAEMVSRVLERFERIDVLFNSARITQRRPATDFSGDAWKRVIEVNLVGLFLCCRAVAPAMIRQQSGSIINMASVAAFGALGRGNTAYTASKGGVVALTRELAIEWAPHGVRVNAIAPCHFRTPPIEPLLDDPTHGPKLVERIPLGRAGDPEDIIGPAVFLAADASRMVTGHVLMVDGGYTAQ